MPRERRPDESFEDYWRSLHADITELIKARRDDLARTIEKLNKMLDDRDDISGALGVRKDKPKKR